MAVVDLGRSTLTVNLDPIGSSTSLNTDREVAQSVWTNILNTYNIPAHLTNSIQFNTISNNHDLYQAANLLLQIINEFCLVVPNEVNYNRNTNAILVTRIMRFNIEEIRALGILDHNKIALLQNRSELKGKIVLVSQQALDIITRLKNTSYTHNPSPHPQYQPHYDDDEIPKIGAIGHCAKVFLIVLNTIFMLFSFALIGFGIYAHVVNFNKFIDIPWPIGMIVIGSFIFALTIFGCCGAIRESKMLLGIYFVLLFFLVAAQVGVIIYSYKYDNGVLENALKLAWEKADTDVKQWAQEYFSCCGFQDITDEPALPCPPGVTQGCKDIIHHYIDGQLYVLQIVCIVIASIQFLGLLFALCLCCVVPSSKERKRLMGSLNSKWNYNSTKYSRIA